jgi:hypothetical protein
MVLVCAAAPVPSKRSAVLVVGHAYRVPAPACNGEGADR